MIGSWLQRASEPSISRWLGEYGGQLGYPRSRRGDGRDISPLDGQEPTGWRQWPCRKIVLTCVLLAILTPVLAVFVGWLFVGVPSPVMLAAQQKQVTRIMASDGTTEIGRYVPNEGNRIPVDLSQVPVQVQNAVLAAEDRSFRSNPGFDIAGIARAAGDQLNGGIGGGSTITQQYVKVATGHDEDSIFRKFREVIIAAKITKRESKDRILQDYLNTIYFGRDAYGIQAASQAYFGKNVQNLTVAEGAVLASSIRSPSGLDPANNLRPAQERWNYVLDGMVAQGWLSKADRVAAQYPTTVPPTTVSGESTDDRAHIVEQVLNELDKQGVSRDRLAVNGGEIVTTIDSRAQKMARDAAGTELRKEPKNLHSALVAIDPRTGGVIAYYGGSDGNGYDLAGSLAFSPGSAFKPFTMTAALEQDIGMNDVYQGSSPVVVDGNKFANSESQSYPELTLHEAMTKSVNTVFIRLAEKVGPPAVRDAAIAAGIPSTINGTPAMMETDGGPAIGITLGQYPVHTIDMASAYATFADDGIRHAPFFVRQYTNSHDVVEYQHVDNPQLAFDQTNLVRNAELARNVTGTLTDVASSSQIPLHGGREVAAKTGTQQLGDTGHNAAGWTIGYTPSISTAVWVGDPANTPLLDANGNDIYGRMEPGEIWQNFMDAYLNGKPKETFPSYQLIGPAAPPVVHHDTPHQHHARQRSGDPQDDQQSDQFDTPIPDQINPPTRHHGSPQQDPCYPFGCGGPGNGGSGNGGPGDSGPGDSGSGNGGPGDGGPGDGGPG